MTDSDRGPAIARAALFAQTLLSAGTFLVAKDALGTPDAPGFFSAERLLALRFALALAILLAMVAIAPKSYAVARGRIGVLLLLGFIAVPLNVGLFFEGAARAPAAHAALGYALTPVFVFLIERVLGRSDASVLRVTGLALSLGGALLMVASRGHLGGPEPLGDLFILGAAASWALYTVISRPLVSEIGARPTMVLSLLAGSLMVLPITVPMIAHMDLAAVTTRGWGDVAYLAVVTTVIAYSLWLFALKRLDATQVAIFTTLQPVATAFLSWWILGERATAAFAVATALVLLGVTLVQRSPAGTRAVVGARSEE